MKSKDYVFTVGKASIRDRILESAKDYNLTSSTTDRLLKFAEIWHEMSGQTFGGGYSDDWANRFKKNKEYIHAVGDALYALIKTDGEKKALRMYTDQLVDQYNYSLDKAVLRAKTDMDAVIVKYGTLKGRKTHRLCKKSDKKPSKIIGKLPNFDANFRKLI